MRPHEDFFDEVDVYVASTMRGLVDNTAYGLYQEEPEVQELDFSRHDFMPEILDYED